MVEGLRWEGEIEIILDMVEWKAVKQYCTNMTRTIFPDFGDQSPAKLFLNDILVLLHGICIVKK